MKRRRSKIFNILFAGVENPRGWLKIQWNLVDILHVIQEGFPGLPKVNLRRCFHFIFSPFSTPAVDYDLWLDFASSAPRISGLKRNSPRLFDWDGRFEEIVTEEEFIFLPHEGIGNLFIKY